MSIIGVVSMKGGVGKTSVTANLAAAMAAALGPARVSVVDLDPQNALHWHFGLDAGPTGVCTQSLTGESWLESMVPSEFGVACLPYGEVSEPERQAFEALLAAHPVWVGERIALAGLGQDAVVLIDTPPGPSAYLKQVLNCADLVLIVQLADAGSYATLPAMEAYLVSLPETSHALGCIYVLNQVDRADPFNRDVTDLLSHQLADRLAPVCIHRDESVGEALAFQQPVLAYAPHGQASHDLARLAEWAIQTLNR